jgi:hypothetical protein
MMKCQLCYYEGKVGSWTGRNFYRCANCGTIQCGNCTDDPVFGSRKCGRCEAPKVKLISG